MRFNIRDSIFAGLSRTTMQAMLTEAQTAYRQLMIGGKPVSVSYDGKAVTYTAADKANLVQYIEELQVALGYNKGRRALRPMFR